VRTHEAIFAATVAAIGCINDSPTTLQLAVTCSRNRSPRRSLRVFIALVSRGDNRFCQNFITPTLRQSLRILLRTLSLS